MRSDAIFKLLANRLPEDNDFASQPTLSRFENSITPTSLLRLEEWFTERFVNSFDEPPREVTLDIDVFDDPAHGAQQLTFFHGYYKQYQYLVRAITCAENDADQEASNYLEPDAVPVEPRTNRERHRHFNRRREADPLGEGHACTWRMRVIQVAARIEVTARCVRVLLSDSWPFLDHFRDIGQAIMKES